MTECERLIANGTFARDFFKPEVRCDFLVDEKRKKIWAILLDLLLQFDAICKKHNLTYYLFGGSLLGAIRHKGIIPWDDDVDVAMPRLDYDKFLSLSREFSNPYYLQIPGVESEYGYSFAKLRNVRTTGSSDMFLYASFNQGIFLDVFPIDNIDKQNGLSLYEAVKSLCIDNSTCMRMRNPHLDAISIQRIERCKRRDIMANLAEIDRIARQYDNFPCDYVGLNTSSIDPYEINVFRKRDFTGAIRHPFEGFSFLIPSGYDSILKDNFGDYMSFPPVNERGTRHFSSTFEPDVPYDEYKAKKIRSAGE